MNKRALAAGGLVLLFASFLALGFWQIERRAWKLALIERVEARVLAPAVDMPARLGDDEYRHVRASGRYLYAAQVFAQAVTTQGSGFWVLTPLQRSDGTLLMVNRGFVPPESRAAVASGPDVEVQLTGLLRLTEPGGAFLRSNEPAAGRWFSRDVAAIAAARGLQGVQPGFFIDAAAAPAGRTAIPVGGLTVVRFHNSHLVYAITWFVLALMAAGAAWYLRQHTADDEPPDDRRA